MAPGGSRTSAHRFEVRPRTQNRPRHTEAIPSAEAVSRLVVAFVISADLGGSGGPMVAPRSSMRVSPCRSSRGAPRPDGGRCTDWTRIRYRRMITSRAIRSAGRHRHLPLHGRRGLDAAAGGAGRGGVCGRARGAPADRASGLLAEHGGIEVDTQGDSSSAVSPRPLRRSRPPADEDALASSRARPDRAPYRRGARRRRPVRRHGRAPRGADRRLGHGGQIVLSRATASSSTGSGSLATSVSTA